VGSAFASSTVDLVLFHHQRGRQLGHSGCCGGSTGTVVTFAAHPVPTQAHAACLVYSPVHGKQTKGRGIRGKAENAMHMQHAPSGEEKSACVVPSESHCKHEKSDVREWRAYWRKRVIVRTKNCCARMSLWCRWSWSCVCLQMLQNDNERKSLCTCTQLLMHARQ